MNLKESIAYAHFAALNGSWLYDEPSCTAMKVCGQDRRSDALPESTEGYQLQLGNIISKERASKAWLSVSGYGYRVFIVEDLADEGSFSTVADPLLPRFTDALFMQLGPYTQELELKLVKTVRHGSTPPIEWLKSIQEIPRDLIFTILDDPRMADCPASYWRLGGIAGSSRGSTLAGWIDLWFGPDYVWFCPDCGGRVLPYQGACGLSSGSITGFCSSCGKSKRDEYGATGKNSKALQILRRHPPTKTGRRPYRIDTVLEKLGSKLLQ